jgi:hypothetical protein
MNLTSHSRVYSAAAAYNPSALYASTHGRTLIRLLLDDQKFAASEHVMNAR